MAARKNLDLKTVLITGGSSGIGLDTAKKLLETKKYRVIILGRNKSKLDAAIKELGGQSDSLFSTPIDLANVQESKKVIEKIVDTHKSIYGLVNNAGIYPFGGVSTTTDAIWDEAFNVNLKSPFFLIQAVIEVMSKNPEGGRIVNVSSTAGLLPNHFALAYSISKAAMIHMTKTLAKEVGKDNITVNCVCPGIVKTPLHENYHHSDSDLENFYAKRGSTFPLGRVGNSDDISGAIKFLLSEEASWITGDIMVIDGGRLLL